MHYDFDAAGRLTQAKSGNVINGFPSYDPDGRPFQSNVQIGGQTYTFNYHWDLAGNLLTETYPSGRVLTFNYDGASRARSVSGVLGGTSTPYVNQTVYWPSGAVNYWQYGNNAWPAEYYTPLLQPANSWTTIGNTGNTYQLYTQNYWNANGTVGGSEECFGPTVPWNNLSCFGQSHTYDNLNRLTATYDSNYSRSFQHDEFGNMSLSTNYGLPLSGLTPMTNASPFDTTTNHVNGNSYDARGNTTQIGTGVGVSYDAENRQIQTVDANTGLTINYVYDGLGQRVEQQIAGGVTTIFVHDALGQLAAKYNNAGVTPPCTTCYLSYDQLGSVRLITDGSGNVVGRHDYLPFGEEIPSGWAGRDAADMFGVSGNVTQMFTGQERDGGSATLDYFNARHLSAVLERFTQPDPGNAGADILNPQSWNGYGYVLGNPLGNVDPSGALSRSASDCISDASRSDPCGIFDEDGLGGGVSFPIGGGGGRRPGGSGGTSAPTQTETGTSGPLPPGSFPGGETLGLPPGVKIPNPGLGILFGLGDECEFGSCEGFASASSGVGGGIFIQPSWLFALVGLIHFPYLDATDPNHRLFGTHYCGPGGGGKITGRLDGACKAHDTCYSGKGLQWYDNFNPGNFLNNKGADIQDCNQRLCNATKSIPGVAPAIVRNYFEQTGWYTCNAF